jgi:hypothetical protein
MNEYFLPNDVARCENESCDKNVKCSRFLDVLPMENYTFIKFKAENCDFFIEKQNIKPKKEKK